MKVFTGEKNQILRGTAKPVEVVDDLILELAENMFETMKKEKGIGLAAPQVGVNKRVIIATLGEKPHLMVNPEITSFSAECAIDEEGCLSLPEQFGKVSRAKRIIVRYLDEKGKKKEEELSDLDARVVQHEIDHLNGILFTDRLMQEQGTERGLHLSF
jgi:peptide deformylase